GVARQVAHEKYFVQLRHGLVPLKTHRHAGRPRSRRREGRKRLFPWEKRITIRVASQASNSNRNGFALRVRHSVSAGRAGTDRPGRAGGTRGQALGSGRVNRRGGGGGDVPRAPPRVSPPLPCWASRSSPG